jgi:acetyl-CoA C-acetyltransferase
MTIDPRTPVLVGAAQYVDRDSDPAAALSPLAMLEQVARGAASDSGAGADLWSAIDSVAVVRTFADSASAFKPAFWHYHNLPHSVAQALGAAPRRLLYPHAGGNTPQMLVNLFAEQIAHGEHEVVLIAGVEAVRTQARAQKSGVTPDWRDRDDGPAFEVIGDPRMGVSKHELGHGIALPANVYPLFENALAAHYGRDMLSHRRAIGDLMARFTQVAAANPYSALPVARTAESIIDPSGDNRYIAYPYTKYLNSNMFVDQAAAVLLMSSGKADALGVPQAKRIYLHGCADTTEKYLVSERVNYWSSPAIHIGAGHALAQAGIGVADLGLIDLYSCFPVAVEIAADEIGLAHNDPRDLTITGGLPYFGGPGNNYVLHSIAEMVQRLRARPGAYGLVTANGMYLTKHSFGVYCSTPTAGAWQRSDPKSYQADIDAMPSPAFTETPDGTGTVETYTVVHDRGQPMYGIVIARLQAGDTRCLAMVADPAQVASMMDQPVVGRRLNVRPGQPANQAVFA